MEPLPVLLSIPHGGTRIPSELRDRLAIGEKEIFEDIDGFTRDIYDLEGKVQHVVKADIARTFVDPSRSESDLPPGNPDGVIKSHTCFGKIIYKKNQQPDTSETVVLIEKYYKPYHKKIQDIARKEGNSLAICFDCHSMAETGPAISPDRGQNRPLFCLGNAFGKSAPDEWMQRIKSCLAEAFELDESSVAINEPFSGGFLTRNYGNNPLPWIQIEMNRSMYLRQPWFDSETLTISKERTTDLNGRFLRAVTVFCS